MKPPKNNNPDMILRSTHTLDEEYIPKFKEAQAAGNQTEAKRLKAEYLAKLAEIMKPITHSQPHPCQK